MFAFAVWDEEAEAPAARPRSGRQEAPLLPEDDGWLSFASELRALMVDAEIPREIDPSSIDCYLAYGYVPAPWSIWQGGHKLQPAHTLVWEDGRTRDRALLAPRLLHGSAPRRPRSWRRSFGA